MRFVFLGATDLTVRTAQLLLDRGHEVVIIDSDRARIDELSDELDCSFIHGDGSRPHLLKEAGPEQTDLVFCLTSNDHVNIIASLVARSLGYERVVTNIEDPEFEGICMELNLEDTIVPSRTIARYLADMACGLDILELSTVIKHDARFFYFTARADDAGEVSELDLPDGARVVCYYRDNAFELAGDDAAIKKGDEVVILTHSEHLPQLRERWSPKKSQEENAT